MKTGRKLASREEAVEYNSKQSKCLMEHGGCIDSRACENCCHVITDEICCCAGIGTCPNCGHKQEPTFQSIQLMPTGDPRDFGDYMLVNPKYSGFPDGRVIEFEDKIFENSHPGFTWQLIENKNQISRSEVYAAIDGERDYQDKQWTGPDHKHEVGAYITMLAHYLHKAQEAWTEKSGDYDALHVVRKIAGIAVHCMEEHGAPKRGEVKNQNGETIQTVN